MTAAVTTRRPLLDILTDGRTLPDGYDAWAFRSVWPDFTSSHGYRWPFPGSVATAAGPILDHRGSCPRERGDGICVATTALDMASGSIPANAVLLTAHRTADVVGDDEPGKLRVREALVVDVLWLRSFNLSGAYLSGANLSRADLYGANLSRADLSGADLGGWERGPDGYARRVGGAS